VKAGLISSRQLKEVLSEQENTSDRLGDILLKKGYVTTDKFAPVLAKYFNVPFIKLKEFYKDISMEVIDSIPMELAYRFSVLPISLEDNALTIAIFDPLDLLAIDTLKIKTGKKIKCVVAAEHDIQEAVEYCYQNLPRMKQSVENFIELETETDSQREEDFEDGQFRAADQPVVQYVRSLIVQAVNSRASDIHLKPKQHNVDLRFRIDGIMYQNDPPPKAMIPAITTRVKILAGLDIAERRLPQDGRYKVKIGKSEVDIRISCFPTIYGESVVMRLLDTSKPLLGLEQLGMHPQDLKKYKEMISHSYGLVLVTGPTGSGKTTTLYTTLNAIKSDDKNILTLEDPVEYRLPFIQQTQVNPQIGFDFARGLRSILRQDPDIIMVGEIRDQETAQIAIHAALTGHLVFATLHTNDAAGAPVRLIKMGVEPFLITSSLLGVIAQRLVRTICPSCRTSVNVGSDMMKNLPFALSVKEFYRGKGCSECFNSGFVGRMGIYELLLPNEEIRKYILNQRSSEELRVLAIKAGMRTMRQSGLQKVQEGLTTPEEILRVTQHTEEL